MKSKFFSFKSRRGITLAETLVASGVMIVVLGATAGVMNTAGRLQEAVTLQVDTDQSGTQGMNRMVEEVREASEVTVLSTNRFRIFYPVRDASGFYNRVGRSDTTNYVEYSQTDQSGTLSSTGAHLWRRTQSGGGISVVKDLTQLSVVSVDPRHIRLTLIVQKRNGTQIGRTELVERVLYLRNSPLDAPDY